jgi:hypothetical protein
MCFENVPPASVSENSDDSLMEATVSGCASHPIPSSEERVRKTVSLVSDLRGPLLAFKQRGFGLEQRASLDGVVECLARVPCVNGRKDKMVCYRSANIEV